MAEILDLSKFSNGDNFDGYIGVKSLMVGKTKNGKEYIYGTLINQKQTWAFKIWDTTLTAKCKTLAEAPEGFKGMVARVTGTVGMYQGALDYTLTFINPEPSIAYADVLPSLDCDTLFKTFSEFINTHISQNYIQALMLIMSKGTVTTAVGASELIENDKSILETFKTAWAASGNHDAIRGGLVNHTLKMLRYAEVMLLNNPSFDKDMVYTAIILHDIGKVQEICDGAYTKNSFVSHRVIGVEYMAMCKPQLVTLIGTDAYYRLVDVIVSHHDKFGNPANTTLAYLVHLIDMLDTYATMFEDELNNPNPTYNNSHEQKYVKHDKNLVF